MKSRMNTNWIDDLVVTASPPKLVVVMIDHRVATEDGDIAETDHPTTEGGTKDDVRGHPSNDPLGNARGLQCSG